jgi:hypothetical protein
MSRRCSRMRKNVGCFNMADLQGKGDFFSGTVKVSCVCQYTRGMNVTRLDHCSKISRAIVVFANVQGQQLYAGFEAGIFQ